MAEKKLRAQGFVQVIESFWLRSEFFAAGSVLSAAHPAVKGRDKMFRPFVAPGSAPSEPDPAPYSPPPHPDKLDG